MKIAAVVVTYNRKGLLQECLDAILGQTKLPDSLVVIDNASTDGTGDLFHAGAKYDQPVIDYRLMDKNLGGAGGFYEGVKLAFYEGFDWIWIMDDDTIPHDIALEELCNAIHVIDGDISFLASSVFGPNMEPMNVPNVETRQSENGYCDWYIHLAEGIARIEDATFVSLMFNRKAVEKVGFPYKDFFIWGDDKEYTLRMSRFFGPAYMIGKSVVTHKRAITKKISIENATDPKRIDQYYYNYRNILVNVSTYRHGWLAAAKRIVEFNGLCVRILKDGNQQYRWRKVKTIHKGIWGFFFGTYDRTKFRKRFQLEEI